MSNAGGMSTVTRYTDMLAGNTTWNPWEPAGAYDALASVSLSAATSSVTFAGIPTGYKHLQIRGLILNASGSNNMAFQFNSSGGTDYASHQLQGNGSTASATSSPSQPFAYLSGLPIATSVYPFVGVWDILDYASTSKNKTIRGLSGQDGNGTGTATDWRITLSSGLWANTAAINSINISSPGNTIGQNTTFALFGVK